MNADAQTYWQAWIEGEHTSERFRVYSKPLIENMRLVSQREDWPAYSRLFDVYRAIEPFCVSEPLLTDYERGLMSVNYHLADIMAVEGTFDRTLNHVNLIRTALAAADDRRAKAGMASRPNSMLRFQCLGLEAICLLDDASRFGEAPPEVKTRSMTREFWDIAQRVENYLQHIKLERPDYVQITMHSMARWELEIVKLCWRYHRELAAEAIRQFNERYGKHLEFELAAFARLRDSELRSAWYWDFELSKLVSAGELTRQQLALCVQGRSSGCRMWVGSGPEHLFEKLWAGEVKKLEKMLVD